MLYDRVDIESSDDGELVLENGDFKIATVAKTIHQAMNFVALTDFGAYVPEHLAGANLGSFVGKRNDPRVRQLMRSSIYFGLSTQGFVDRNDVQITVSSLASDEVLVMLKTQPPILEPDIDDVVTTPIVIGYIFPYVSGVLEKIDIDETVS